MKCKKVWKMGEERTREEDETRGREGKDVRRNSDR